MGLFIVNDANRKLNMKAFKSIYPENVANPDGLLIGCDPEVFVFDTQADRYISAHDLIPGTKAAPYPVEAGAVQVDGMALEFNTSPAKTPKEFETNVRTVIEGLRAMIPAHLRLAAKPTVEFGAEYMATVPEEAKELGCEPDFNAYTNGAPNPRPNAEATFRTGAGHIHIGWGKDFPIDLPEHINVCCLLAKQLDFFLGAAIGLSDADQKRRTLYGMRGSFRPKSYGMEYRPLSNAWLRDPNLYSVIPQLVYKAWEVLKESGGSVYSTTTAKEFWSGTFTERTLRGIHAEVRRFIDIALPTSPDHKFNGGGRDAGEPIVFENNPFDFEFTTANTHLTNFDEIGEELGEMGITWGDGSHPMAYKFDSVNFTVFLMNGKYLRIDPGTDYPMVDLAQHRKGAKKATGSNFEAEKKYFI
jgi:hypothetical protein